MLYKVWNASGVLKKAVVVEDLMNLKVKGCAKLNIMDPSTVTAYMEDGTEIDEDEVLLCLDKDTVIYLLTDEDERPWDKADSSMADSSMANSSMAASSVASTSGAWAEETGASHQSSVVNLHLERWPSPFILNEGMFAPNLVATLKTGKPDLVYQRKSSILDILSAEVMRYTDAPSPAQVKEVAQSLCLLFPTLKSQIGDGCHKWQTRIYDKMRECRRQKRARLESQLSSAAGGKPTKIPRRLHGEVNYDPAAPDGEDEVTIVAHEEWLRTEAKKVPSSWDTVAMKEKMLLTFSNRRRLVLHMKPPLKELQAKYPALFTVDGLCDEFARIMLIDLDERVLGPISSYLPTLLRLAEKRKGCKMENDIALLYINFSEGAELNQQVMMGILLLPFLLGESSKNLFAFYPVEVAVEEISKGPTTPHLAVVGSFETKRVFVVAEGTILVDAGEFLKGVLSLVALFYSCNCKYPTSNKMFYNFLEVALLKLPKSKPSRKVNTLLEKLK